MRSAKDVEGIRNSLVKFQKSCRKHFFDDDDEKDLHRFIDQLERRYGSEWTVRNYMITVLAFMRKEGRPGLMTYSEIPDPEPLAISPRDPNPDPNARSNYWHKVWSCREARYRATYRPVK